jgi:membrane protein DedA with SNARE-associated domain
MVGMSSGPTLVFVFLNAFSALLWAGAIGSGGYLFGRALELALGKIKTYEIIVGAGLALVGLLIWLIHGIRRRRNKPV